MNKFLVDFIPFLGEYIAFYFLFIIPTVLVLTAVFLILVKVSFKLCDWTWKIKSIISSNIRSYVKWRVMISKIVWRNKKPLEETYLSRNGIYKTRKYYF